MSKKRPDFESVSDNELPSLNRMLKEKRPRDWSLEEKLNIDHSKTGQGLVE